MSCKVGLQLCEACVCLLISLLAGGDCQWHSLSLYFPYIPTCLEGFSAVGDFKSDMQMTTWDWEQNEGCQNSAALDLMKKDKRLQREQTHFSCTKQTEITVLGECTHFELRNDLETKTVMFLWFCTDSAFLLTVAYRHKNNDAAHTCCMENMFL